MLKACFGVRCQMRCCGVETGGLGACEGKVMTVRFWLCVAATTTAGCFDKCVTSITG